MLDLTQFTGFTPGPWEVHNHEHCDGEFWCSIGHDGRGPITDIVGEDGNKTEYCQTTAVMKYLITPVEEQRANAQLIAAAPELLEECKRLQAILDTEIRRNANETIQRRTP